MASSAPSAAPGSAPLLTQVGLASLQGGGLEPDKPGPGMNRAPEARASREGWVRETGSPWPGGSVLFPYGWLCGSPSWNSELMSVG